MPIIRNYQIILLFNCLGFIFIFKLDKMSQWNNSCPPTIKPDFKINKSILIEELWFQIERLGHPPCVTEN